ncbi:MAG: hypothetical protein CMF42_01225 [Legionellales bacterium]|nr:hypothetical protein [Legionellales bacterium]
MKAIKQILFPDNLKEYHGPSLCMKIMKVYTLYLFIIGLLHVFIPSLSITQLFNIDLLEYSKSGRSTLLTLFAIIGVSQLSVGLILYACIRKYKGFIPFLILVFIFNYTLTFLLSIYNPVLSTSLSLGYIINTFIYIILILSFCKIIFDTCSTPKKKGKKVSKSKKK